MAKDIQSAAMKRASTKAAPSALTPVSRENAEHYRWGVDCDAWYLVNDEQLSVIEEFMPPGAAEIRHHHTKAQQFFYIVSGEVLMEVEGQTMLLAAGSGRNLRTPNTAPSSFHFSASLTWRDRMSFLPGPAASLAGCFFSSLSFVRE